MSNEMADSINQLATKKVSRKKFLGLGLAVAATTAFSGILGKSRKVAAKSDLSLSKEERLEQIYSNITKIKK
jgi:hypothetical protein